MALIPGTLPAGTKYPNDPQTLLDTFAGYLTAPSSGAIPKTVVDAKGDVLTATSNNVVARLPVGANGSVLTANSAESTGLKWDNVLNSAAINGLTSLNATPDSSDQLVIDDAGTVKKISVGNLVNATLGITGTKNVADGVNLALNTGNGTKIGTSDVQKLAFWGATPIPQPNLSGDLLDNLQAIGLISSGSGNTPLNLSDGAVTCGTVSCGTINLKDGADLVPTAVAGSNIATSASQKIGFWGAQPTVRPEVTDDLLDSLQTIGLIQSGAGNTPLNLSGGAFKCGTAECDTITLNDAANIVVNNGTGTKIATTPSAKLGFWNATPTSQPAAVPNISVNFTAGGTPTANGVVTVANSASPTNAELLDYCVELEATLEALLSRLRTIGIIAT